jgi:hypothetical protein
MPVNLMPAQNVGQFVDAAQFAGYMGQQRDDRRFYDTMAQRDRQFYTGLAYDAARDERNYVKQRELYDHQMQQRAEYERQQLMDRIETEQSNYEWEYSKEQERKLKQLDEDDRRIDQLALDEQWDDQTIRDVKWQNYQKRTGVQPQAIPKKDPWASLPVVTVNGKKYRKAEGRNGAPAFYPEDPLELDPQIAAELKFKAELEAPQIEAEQAKQTAAALKTSVAFARQQKLDAMKMLHDMKTATVANGTGVETRAYSDAEIEAFKQEFADQLSGVVDVSTPQEAMMLPPGTRFRTPDGRTKIRP